MKWAKARPWLSGFYFGLWIALGLGAYVGVARGIELGFVAGVVIWAAAWPMFAIGTKRRWALRPDVDDAATPTLRHPFSQASDRWLSLFMWFFAAGAVVLVVGLATGADRPDLGGFGPLVLDVLIVWITWTERRHRANAH